MNEIFHLILANHQISERLQLVQILQFLDQIVVQIQTYQLQLILQSE